jgi:uncharacterized Zn finger protein
MTMYGPPRPVEGGIRARTERGTIGEEWWSRRFIDVLESFADSGRLSRGRAYARKGQVVGLTVAPYEVTATVQGSRDKPYDVTIGIDAIDEPAWEAIEEALAAQAVFRARLLAGEMPPEIEEVFAAFGIPLFPGASGDLHLMCSCPDWGEPCKHAAAVLYLLAEAFDDDPFLILAWNGRTREALLAGLRRHDAARAAHAAEAADPLEIEETPLAERLDDFWTPAAVRDRPPAPPMPPGLLLKLLDPPKVKVRRRDLVEVLKPAYDAMAEEEPA